jgi:hypothetical protein
LLRAARQLQQRGEREDLLGVREPQLGAQVTGAGALGVELGEHVVEQDAGHLVGDVVAGEGRAVLVEGRDVVEVTEPGRFLDGDVAAHVPVALVGHVLGDCIEAVHRVRRVDLVGELVRVRAGGEPGHERRCEASL